MALKDGIIALYLFYFFEPEFPFLMLSANQENYWYHFFNAFGMLWSLTGD